MAAAAACSPDARVARHVRQLPLAAPSAAVVDAVRRSAVAPPLSGAVAFNTRSGTARGVSVYWISSKTRWADVPRDVTEFRDNCGSLQSQRLVACDEAFPIRYVTQHSLYPPTAEEKLLFTRWCVAHELGHVLLDRESDTPAVREYRADCWFLHSLSPEDFMHVVALADNLIDGSIRERFGTQPAGAGIIYDYNHGDYDFRTTDDHPDILMRAVRVLVVAQKRQNDPGVAAMLRPFLARLKTDPVWHDDGRCVGGLL